MSSINSRVTLALLPLLTMTLLTMGCGDSTAPLTEREASPENGMPGPSESMAIQPALAASVEDCPAGTRTPGLAWFRDHFHLGPEIPSTRTDFVSQGLGYWAAKDWLITSLSEGSGLPNRIAIKNRSTGAFIKFLVPAGSDGLALPGHMGGVSVSTSNLWISTETAQGNKVVYRIPLSTVAATPTSGYVRANHVWNVGASSYSTFYPTGTGNYLYFGTFAPEPTGTSTMVRYLLSSTEDIVGSGVYISTPTQVQGVTVADGHYIFSTSYGRQCYSRLQFKNISTGVYGRTVQLPPMSEGIVRVPLGAAGWADDVLYVNFESGSNKYADAVLRTFYFYYALITELTP